MAPRSKPWFGPKFIGIGIGPASWEGWLSLFVFIFLFSGALSLRERTFAGVRLGEGPAWALAGAVVVGFLLLLALKTDRTRRLRWRWWGGH